MTINFPAASSTYKTKSCTDYNPLAFLLNLTISKAFAVQTPGFVKVLLNSRQRIEHDLEAVAVVVSEISTSKLKSNFDFFQTLSIFIPFSVQTPVFEKMLLKSTRRITDDLGAVAVMVDKISTVKLNSNLAFF